MRKKLSEGCSAGLVRVSAREVGVWFAATDAALAARVAWRNSWMTMLISALGVGAGGRAGGMWGFGTVGDGAEKDHL